MRNLILAGAGILVILVVAIAAYVAREPRGDDREIAVLPEVVTFVGRGDYVQIWDPAGKGVVLYLNSEADVGSEFCFGASFSRDGRYVATSHHPTPTSRRRTADRRTRRTARTGSARSRTPSRGP